MRESRRRRKRNRLRAEAIVNGPRFTGGWGGAPGDIALVRQAVREGWATPLKISRRILKDLAGALESPDAQTVLRVCRLLIEIDSRDP